MRSFRNGTLVCPFVFDLRNKHLDILERSASLLQKKNQTLMKNKNENQSFCIYKKNLLNMSKSEVFDRIYLQTGSIYDRRKKAKW